MSKETTMEESMAPKETKETKSTKIQEYSPIDNSGIDNVLAQLVNLNPDNILHEPTCLICSCSNREEVENKWLETKDVKVVKEIFKSKNNYAISDDVLENHMRFHYNKGVKELQKIEYINKIKRLNSTELTTLDTIKFAIAVITERLTNTNSLVPDTETSNSEIEKIKSSETSKLTASLGQLLKLKMGLLGEMMDSGKLIIMPKEAFISVFNKAILESKDGKEKEIIGRLLNALKELNQEI